LDRDEDGCLKYNDFCEILEEKRRNIDPYESILTRVRAKQEAQSRQEKHDYFLNKGETEVEEPSKASSLDRENIEEQGDWVHNKTVPN
jgi:hypothetical protein